MTDAHGGCGDYVEGENPRRRSSDICAFHKQSFEDFQKLVTVKMDGLETLIDGKFNLLAERIKGEDQRQKIADLEKRIQELEKRVWKIIGGTGVGLVVVDILFKHFIK